MNQLIEGKQSRKKSVRTNIQRTRQHDRESLECTLRNRLPHPTGEKPQGRTYSLIIPNESIRQIFIEQIQEWFKETTRKDENRLKDFCKAFEEGNAEAIEEQFNNYLMKTISIRDTFTTKKKTSTMESS